jgi:colicin import membrane protein
MRRSPWLVSGITLALLAAGCAEPPQAEIDAVNAALQEVQAGDAPEYAPDALRAAEDAKAALEAEIKAQAEKFALTRNYDVALQKATAAKEAAAAAQTQAAAAKEKAMNDATAAIAAQRTALAEARTLLAGAPKGKGTKMDLAAMGTDLDGAEQALNEADALMASSRYREAAAKAQASGSSIMAVKTQVEDAMAAVGRK